MTFKGHLVKTTYNELEHLQLDQVTRNLIQPDLEYFQDRAPLSNLFQCFTTFIVKCFFFIPSLNLPPVS